MEVSYKTGAITILVAAVIGGAVTKLYMPTIKIVTIEKVVEHNTVVTHTRTIKSPDGTETTDTDTTQNQVIVDDKKSTVVDNSKAKDWFLEASRSISVIPTYGIGVNRRILGPVFVGVRGETSGQISVSVGMEF